MATATMANEIETIGITAGKIWHYLGDNGPVAMSRLVKEIDSPRDAVMQGVGWLAREGKVEFEDGPRSRIIGLA